MHTGEKDIFILNALRISLAPTPQEGRFHVMFVRRFVRNQHIEEQKRTEYVRAQESRYFENNVCTR